MTFNPWKIAIDIHKHIMIPTGIMVKIFAIALNKAHITIKQLFSLRFIMVKRDVVCAIYGYFFSAIIALLTTCKP